jgi:N-acetylglucosaminyldiphosphoundecaprenol N-acetyl-beta-D-mannosaminyltransferase
MAVGGAFDMLTGKLDRAPKLLQQLQLEWLYRLYQEPWRWRRQLSLFEFMKLTVQEVLS